MQYIIPTIFTAVDKFSRPVMRMQGTLMRLHNEAIAASASTALLAAGALIPLGLATKAAMDFEKQMTNVATLVDTTKESMSAMGDELLDVAARVPVKISDLTESLYQVRSAGVAASDAMHVLEVSAKLSVAGLSSATDATKAVTSALVSFRSQGLTADQIANSFFLTVKEGKTKMEGLNASFGENAPLVASAGVKLQEFNAATAAMTNAGMSASEAQNGLRMSVLGLIKPTTEMTQVFARLGVRTGEDLLTKMNGLGGALDAVATASKQLNIESPKLFNRTALTAYTLLVGNLRDSFRANTKEQMQGINAVDDAYYKQLGTTASQAQLAKNNLQILGITVGTLLLPAINALLHAITPVIQHISKWVHEHKVLSGILFKSVAAIGILAASVSVLSFVIGTATKFTLLWKIGLLAFNIVSTVAAGILNAELAPAILRTGIGFYSYAAGVYAAEAGTTALNISSVRLLGTLASIALVVYALQKAYSKFYNDSAKLSTDKFNAAKNALPEGQQAAFEKKFTTPANEATMASIFSLSKEDSKNLDDQINANYKPDEDGRKDSTNALITDTAKPVNVYNNITVDKEGNVSVSTNQGSSGVPQPTINKTFQWGN